MQNPLLESVEDVQISHDDLAQPLEMVGGIENAIPMVLSMFGADVDGDDASPVIGAIAGAFERRERIEVNLAVSGARVRLVIA